MKLFFALLTCLVARALADVAVSVANPSPLSLTISSTSGAIVYNSAILAGLTNDSTSSVSASASGVITGNGGQITWSTILPNVVKVQVTSTEPYTGAQFSVAHSDLFYGVWEYPWNDELTNTNVTFELLGVGDEEGVNWSNARAPFFITTAGYGVYADTMAMGTFDFTKPTTAQFVFNTSSLTYYIILPQSQGDYKSIIETYTGPSARVEMPPDSGYGPTFWSDNFEQDFHGYVSNAQQNYYDVIDHLYYNQVHATSMFADRPYGTGNSSFGNFDFDPVYYPNPAQFIANLSTHGFDFQVWVANRAFLDTELYNASVANGWLFPGYNPEFFLGPALNLSIPAAYDYFKQKLAYYPSVGVKGFKIDRGEEGEMPDYEQNIQQPLFEQLCYEVMAEKWGESGFYTFSRSAVDRSRATTQVWNGDSHSNFSGLAYSVTSGIRAGLVAFSTWGSDTGGYIRDIGYDDPSPELWARWMWFSTYSPVYELMLGTNHTPYYDPYVSTGLVGVMKQTANEHHLLRPYIKSYTYVASQTGVPVIRALFLETPGDASVYQVTDEYFFGEAFLVAPIINGGGTRKVYFPVDGTGAKYLDYYNGTTVFDGGSTTSVDLDWDSSPVYVKAGAIVPKGDTFQGNNRWTANWQPSLTIEVFPTYGVPQTSFTYFNGQEVMITMTTNKTAKSVRVQYGDLGVSEATLVFFGSNGAVNQTLAPGGGVATVTGFGSLFD